MNIEQKISGLGLELPVLPPPAGSYVPSVRTGQLVFTAGQLPMRGGKLIAAGKVPADVTMEVAQACARQSVLNALAAVAAQAGSLDAVARVVRANVFVNSTPTFTEQPAVANAASELLVAIFGEAGKHTRCALGAAALPLNAPVEIDLVVELKA